MTAKDIYKNTVKEVKKNRLKKFIKRYIRDLVEVIGIATIITLAWQGIELLLFKETRPNMIDTVIGLCITFLLHDLYKKYLRYI